MFYLPTAVGSEADRSRKGLGRRGLPHDLRLFLAEFSVGTALAPCGLSGEHRCVRSDPRTRPHDFGGLGAMDVPRAYQFIWLGDVHGPEP